MLKQDRQEWLKHPVTQDFVSRISIEYENIKEVWASGGYHTEHDYLEAVGVVKGLRMALDLVAETGGENNE